MRVLTICSPWKNSLQFHIKTCYLFSAGKNFTEVIPWATVLLEERPATFEHVVTEVVRGEVQRDSAVTEGLDLIRTKVLKTIAILDPLLLGHHLVHFLIFHIRHEWVRSQQPSVYESTAHENLSA